MNTREIAAEYRLSHWAGIMRDREESGLSIRAYCENAGFHENIYFYWQRKLREATCEELAKVQARVPGQTSSGFAEVKVSAQSAPMPETAAKQEQISVETSGLRITAGSGYPADKLAHLVRAVMQSC